jgi:very-short-patch-repair endonuclease
MDVSEVRRLAATQCGLVHRRQLSEIGLSRSASRHLIEREVLAWCTPTVLRLVGSPDSLDQRALAAVLDAGAGSALSHETAGAWWEVPSFLAEPLRIIRPHGVKPRPSHLAVVHQSRDLLPHHCVELRGVPVTTPARTLLDLAGVLTLGRTARALDTALARRLVRLDELEQLLDEVARKGRPGVVALRTLIAERRTEGPLPESALELRFEQVLRRHGLPSMERQVELGGHDGRVARVDYFHRVARIVVFVDSATYHTALLDRAHDDAQTAALRGLGYTVLRFSDAQVLYREDEIVDALRHAFRCARSTS